MAEDPGATCCHNAAMGPVVAFYGVAAVDVVVTGQVAAVGVTLVAAWSHILNSVDVEVTDLAEL